MVQQRVGRPQQAGQQPSSSQQVQSQSLPASGHGTVTQKQVDYVLPSRRRADVLMGTYWSYVHVLYPYLDKLHIQEDYERLWKADGTVPDEQSFMCLLNVTFALSSQLDEATPIEERAQLAHVFYTRARELLDIVETGSVRSVQSFLLLGQYFQSTNEPHHCWVFIGLAVRTAQSLGLHLPETSERAADTRTRELLRKLWHGCVLMDRVVSMTYGRPCMIGPKAAVTVPVPSLVDEDEVALLRSSPFLGGKTKETYSVEFFVLSLKLYEILHDVIFNFYSVNCQQIQPLDSDRYFGSLDESHSSIFEIERRLSNWEQSIPNHLRMANNPDSGSVEAVMYRQAVILHQRQLHVRILLLRPVLSNSITSSFHDPNRYIPLRSMLSHRIFLQCAIVCVKIALEAINTIHRERGESAGDIGFLAAWWYNVLYIYTSATVLIAARLSPAILADVSEESILDGWRKAMDVLEGYSPFGVSIQRLTTTLRLLFEAVPQQYSRFRETARQIQPDASLGLQSQAAGTGALPDWRWMDPVNSVPDSLDDLSREYSEENNNALTNEFLLGFDTVFDPNDLSWLTTIPLDSG
ncbi:hypothetical protein LTS07_003943 [Exophiala sideris]|uniref:Xylanolytic transcriptional activator regulatory domain-containing protein n=1 Tax=Exophiala sideris TaxID=1016849 RepID=A0ABR0JFT0_9EURO|nr:hypothetical protein LTS07_003943 [Exophiala sideris]KAK5037287.1 hypothetical protein LTR13_005093 [Exophiala sideris]KAK5062059.1 hypothetical protein LTR69_004416 [Exophiala sideris]KAK5182445.1 hypothetical protein LTR44_005457 [Eurotiomycetes sp. CCFEE 6388]